MLDHVLSPFRIRGVELRNRVVRASQGTGLGLGQRVTDDLIAFNVARARGGVALAFADIGQVHWSSPGMIDMSTDDVIDGMRRLTDAVHAEGMKMFQQIWHGGATQMTMDSSAPWSASHAPDPGLGILPVPMTKGMIDEVTEAFVSASLRARECGLDGIEFHGGHGYLFSSFLSPATNLRDDEYGGSFENRCRFLLDVLEAVRAAVGPDYVMGIRLSPDGPEDQTTASDLLALSQILEERGLVDYLSLSLGSHYGRDLLMGGAHEPPGYMLPHSEKVTRQSRLPTIVAGRFTTLAEADEVIASGAGDLVSMVRATLAEPELVRKTVEGRTGEIRPCISCNQACAGGLNTRARAMCVVNPASGRERTMSDDNIPRTDSPRHVVIAGGGPAGLEAARSATIAGHRVTVLEAASEIGGQLRLTRHSPHRPNVSRVIDFYSHEMVRLGIDVRCDTRADRDVVAALEPDAVLIATGVEARRDGFQTLRPSLPLAGIDTVDVLTGWDVLGGAHVGENVLLLDEIGHYESMDVAQYLVGRGHVVHQVSRYALVGANLEMRWEMIGAPNYAILMRGDFEFHPRSVILSVEPGRAMIAPHEADHRVRVVDVDTFVFMSGGLPDRDLQNSLDGVAPVVRVIGDASAPRRLEAAITEGWMSVASLDPAWRRPFVRYGWTGSAT